MRNYWSFVGVVALACLVGQRAAAQTTPTANQPVAMTPDRHTNESSAATAILDRTVTLHLENVPLRAALQALAAAADIRVTYSRDEVPLDKRVSLVADKITVRDALRSLLENTGLGVSAFLPSRVVVRPLASNILTALSNDQQGTATISGLVTDSGTGALITEAIVHVDGTQLTVRTNATGHYTVSGLAAGEYRVTAKHVGYLSKTRVVTLTDGATKATDFELNEPATTLNEVVTTALGDQRRYQVGNVISTINVDSIAPNAPVTSVTDLITGRAPGVDVVESSGMVGSGEDIRIRGVSSLLLQGDPIIIVDGVREDNTAGGALYAGFNNFSNGGAPAPYRLNDLDYSQIASIDILKGPAATTEYGTDGANGVIIITTKRGVSGRPQWNASVSQSASTIPLTYPPIVWNWGHTTDGIAAPFTNGTGAGSSCWVQLAQGNGYAGVPNEPNSTLEGGICVVDSVTSFNPLDHAATTEYGTGPSGRYDVDVGGGSDALRYYFAGGTQNQTGVFKVPDVFRSDALALGFSNSLLQPNTQNQSSLRENTTIKASATVNVQANVAYMSTYADFPEMELNNYGASAATDNVATFYGYNANNAGNSGSVGIWNSPLAQALGYNYSQGTERWTGSTAVDWRPASWLAGNLTAGIDHEALNQIGLYAPQAALLASDYTDTAGQGSLSQQQGRNDVYNLNLRESATATLWHVARFTTSVGASYVDTRYSTIAASSINDLSASAFTLNEAAKVNVSTSGQTVKSGGMYIAEDMAVGDRCFMPLGLRFNVASGYGTSVSGTQNPNYALTCTVLTGRTSLRLRGAYGVSDQQPPYGANFGVYGVRTAQAANAPSSNTIYIFAGPGNQQVKPERDQEVEGGFDLGLWNERLHVGFTAYNKRARDLLYSQSLGWDLEGAYIENVGNVRNEGLEATVTATMVQSRVVTLGVTLNGSVDHNKLLTLAPDLLTTSLGFGTNQYFAAGYPLFGYWGDSIRYRDVNGDGELEVNEVQSGASRVYAGSSAPAEMASLAPTVGLWRNTVMINAMFQYEGDYKVYNSSSFGGGSIAGLDPGVSGLTTPLWEQAMGDAMANAEAVGFVGYSDQFLDGTYVAWNELSVAVSLPHGWVRAAHLRSLSVVGAVRNLALWTTYPFGDPRVGVTGGASYNAASNINSPANDIRSTILGIVPLTRQWTLRLNAGL